MAQGGVCGLTLSLDVHGRRTAPIKKCRYSMCVFLPVEFPPHSSSRVRKKNQSSSNLIKWIFHSVTFYLLLQRLILKILGTVNVWQLGSMKKVSKTNNVRGGGSGPTFAELSRSMWWRAT